jgi:hypothetical protein
MIAGMINERRPPIPLRPDRDAVNRAAVSMLCRAAIASGLATLDKMPPATVAKRWEDHRDIELLTRAAVSPTAIAGNPALTQISFAFLQLLQAASAGADLLARSIVLDFNGAAQISCPGLSVPTSGFVAEGQPIPVIQSVSNIATMVPKKISVIASLTSEMMRSTNAETLVRTALVDSAAPPLDAVLFSANAATAAAPAGLLAGIAPLTPAGSGSPKADLLVDDLQKLIAAIAPVAGNANVAVVAAPAQYVALRLRLLEPLSWPLMLSNSLPSGTVVAVAVPAIVAALEGAPVVESSMEAEIHRETVPAEIVSAPGVVATPISSMWQLDSVALKMRWPISWGLRDVRGVAWMSGVNW